MANDADRTINERLLAALDRAKKTHHPATWYLNHTDILEAADEIERLNHVLDDQKGWPQKLGEARAEIERLRAVLREISEWADSTYDYNEIKRLAGEALS